MAIERQIRAAKRYAAAQRFARTSRGKVTAQWNRVAKRIQSTQGTRALQRTLAQMSKPRVGSFAKKIAAQRKMSLASGLPSKSPRRLALRAARAKAARAARRGGASRSASSGRSG